MILLFTLYFTLLNIPSFEEVKSLHHSSYGVVLDSDHNLLAQRRFNFNENKYPWLKLNEFNHSMLKTLVMLEDKRFYEHRGVDFISFFSNLKNLLLRKSLRGASTLSMQTYKLMVAKKMDKLTQMLGALKLELFWNKEQILETYLNIAPLRSDTIGFHAASLRYFSKIPKHLTSYESLVLISFLSMPNKNWAQIQKRSLKLANYFDINVHELKISNQKNIKQYPFLFNQFVAQNSIRETNLNRSLMDKFEKYLNEVILANAAQNMDAMALVIFDNYSEQIITYLSSSLNPNNQLDFASRPRQAGSILKPFLYAYAIDQKFLTEDSLINDTNMEILVDQSRIYRSKNYDKAFHGEVTVREALASSLNIPAIWTLNYIGGESFFSHLKQYLPEIKNNFDFYGPSLALGTLDVNLNEMTFAYLNLYKAKYVSPEAAFIVSDILADNLARRIGFNAHSPLHTSYQSSVKTGTSKDLKDNWCIGYTQYFTVGVWAGNTSGKPMKNISGISGAAPVWRKVMDELMKNKFQTIKIPETLVAKNGKYYLPGSEPEVEYKNIPSQTLERNQILHPLDGTVLAIDPHIPKQNQNLWFKSKFQGRWYLEDQLLGDGDEIQWNIKKGKYTVYLKDQFKTLDSISFIVK